MQYTCIVCIDVDATAMLPYTISLCCHAFVHACAKTGLASYAFVVVTDGIVIHFTILRHIYIIFVFYFFVLKFED